ncbi:MAG: class I SAM-dependent methyltransferase [Kofleriaceae bacterium]
MTPVGPHAVKSFRHEPLIEIARWIQGELAAGTTRFEMQVLDPDRGRGLYAGERVGERIHRPYRVWIDLADRLGLRMLTPIPEGHDAGTDHDDLVTLRFERLDRREQLRATGDPTERYGASSPFARISKGEEPGFVLDLADAIERTRVSALGAKARVLDLGVNTGDEIALMRELGLRDARFVGVDHSASAIEAARVRFPDVELHVADLNALASLALGRFDLVVSIGTLQSPGVDDRDVVRRVVQDHLAEAGSVILGLPNCRYVDGELEHGTRVKNLRQPELGLLLRDATYYRRYLHQHGKRVFVTGQHYVLVTGVPADDGGFHADPDGDDTPRAPGV